MSKISFYREKNFKKTEIGEIPREWEVRRLVEIIEKVISGDWGSKTEKENTILAKVIRGTDFTAILKRNFDNLPKRYIKKEKIQKIKLKTGDLIIEISGGSNNQPTGRIVIINDYINQIPLTFSNFVKKIELVSNVWNIYIYYLWNYLYLKGYTKLYESRTTNIRNFRFNNFVRNIFICLPPLEEQKNIAKVLKVFDDLLENIEKQIKTLERVKKGLMNIYFTKGVFKHETFKDTEIGRIPAEWEVRKIGDIFEFIRGYSYKSSEITIEKTNKILITINNFEKEGGFTDQKGFVYLSNNIQIPQKFLLEEPALLVANTDMSKGFIIGAPILVNPKSFSEKVAYSMDLTRLKPKSEKSVYLDFVYYFLSYPLTRRKAKAFAQGTNVLHLNHLLFGNLKIPLPPLEEQKAIAERLKTIDDQIENLKKQKEHLQKVKKKFMDLLITGKIRVKLHS